MMRAVQVLFELMLATPVDGFSNRARFKLLSLIRETCLRFGDPIVRYNLSGSKVLLPFSHQMPFYRRRFSDYSANIGRITHQAACKYPDSAMIDIGANVGDTAALVRAQ